MARPILRASSAKTFSRRVDLIYISVYSRNEFTSDRQYQEVHKKTLDRVFAGGLEMAYMPEDEKERIKREVWRRRVESNCGAWARS
jgi:hypothetical protein